MAREAAVEKRVFSLYGRKDLLWLIGARIFLIVLASVFVAFHSSEAFGRCVFTAFATFALVAVCLMYRTERSEMLEVSDEGLVWTAWPNRVLSIGWDAIVCCKVDKASESADRPFIKAIVNYSRWNYITIPGSCPDAADILEILKQRVPESVFVAR
jgi:hypothetical protein